MGTRDEILEAVAVRYRAAARAGKGKSSRSSRRSPGIIASTPNGCSGVSMLWTDRGPDPDGEYMTRLCETRW